MLSQPLHLVLSIRNAVAFIGFGIMHWECCCNHWIWCHTLGTQKFCHDHHIWYCALGMVSGSLDLVLCIGNGIISTGFGIMHWAWCHICRYETTCQGSVMSIVGIHYYIQAHLLPHTNNFCATVL